MGLFWKAFSSFIPIRIQNKNKKVENLSESYNEENVEVENNTNEDEKNNSHILTN